jgi:thiol-disulfide isomerase/thioredoxin
MGTDMFRRWWKRVAILLALGLALAACGGAGGGVPEGISEGRRGPDFSLEALGGGEVTLSDHRGDVVLINFWATWCAPCRAEIPAIEAVHQARQNDGFVVLGVNYQESRDVVEPFARELAISYPVLLDESGRVMETYRAIGLPMSILVDREGIIQVRHAGVLTESQLESYLDDLLQ